MTRSQKGSASQKQEPGTSRSGTDVKSEMPEVKKEPIMAADTEPGAATPVRRSRRAPVPSSRFKDMEMETLTPKRKRSSHSVSESPSEAEIEEDMPRAKISKLRNDNKTVTTLEMHLQESPVKSKQKIKKDKKKESLGLADIPEQVKDIKKCLVQPSKQPTTLTNHTQKLSDQSEEVHILTKQVQKASDQGAEHVQKASDQGAEHEISNQGTEQDTNNQATESKVINQVSEQETSNQDTEPEVSNQDSEQETSNQATESEVNIQGSELETKKQATEPEVNNQATESEVSTQATDTKQETSIQLITDSEMDRAESSQEKIVLETGKILTTSESIHEEILKTLVLTETLSLKKKDENGSQNELVISDPPSSINEHEQHSSASEVTLESNVIETVEEESLVYEEVQEESVVQSVEIQQEDIEVESILEQHQQEGLNGLQKEGISVRTTWAADDNMTVVQQDPHMQTSENELVIVQEGDIESSSTVETVGSHSHQMIALDDLHLGSEQITLTQKDGKTIAILTLPSKQESDGNQVENISANADISDGQEQPSYVVKEANQPFVGQSGTTVLNLELDTIDNLFKNRSPASKSINPVQVKPGNQVSGHGRAYKGHGQVIKINSNPDDPNKSMATPSTALTYSGTSMRQVITTSGGYSLLPQQQPPPQVIGQLHIEENKEILPPNNAGRTRLEENKGSESPVKSTSHIGGTVQKPRNIVILNTSGAGVVMPDKLEREVTLAANSIQFPNDNINSTAISTSGLITITPKQPTVTISAANGQMASKMLVQHLTNTIQPRSASESLINQISNQKQRKVIIKESINPGKLVQEKSQADSSFTSDDKIVQKNEVISEQTSKEKFTELSKALKEAGQAVETGYFANKEVHSEEQDESALSAPVTGVEVEAVNSQLLSSENQDIDTDSAESSPEDDDQSSRLVNDSNVLSTAVVDEDGNLKLSDELAHSLQNSEIGLTDEENSQQLKLEQCGGTIKIVENGVEYQVKVIDDSEEIADDDSHMEHDDDGDLSLVKQELVEEEVDFDDVTFHEGEEEDGKQTLGTQTTMYGKTSDRTMKKQVFTAASGPIHKLATIVNEDGQKKQYYYVSIVPNKGHNGDPKLTGPGPRPRSPGLNCVIDGEGYYCCNKCTYKTDRKANFYKHRRLHSGTKPHTCPVCQYKAGTSSNLKRHMGIHDNIRQHKCEICGLSFRQKIHLERHVKYKHEEKQVKCPYCSYICANEQPDLKMHIKRKHSSPAFGEPVTCPECKAELGSKKDLKQHMKFHKDGPELKLFCKECSFVTDCQSRLKRHSAIHEKVKPFMCGLCQYRAAQKEHVLRHLRTQHKIEVKRDGKRAWRRKNGGPDKQFEPPEIQGGVKERADFSSGDKIFACNHCTMRFAKLINLYKHLHTQHCDIMPPETEGNYYCVVCEFSTSSKKNLLVHMRRHNLTDQTPPSHVYSCVLCRYVNPKRRNLFQHMRKKHNIDIAQGEGEGEGDGDETSQEEETSIVIKQEATGDVTGEISSAVQEGGTHATVRILRQENEDVEHIVKIEDLKEGSGSESDSYIDSSHLVIDTRGPHERRKKASHGRQTGGIETEISISSASTSGHASHPDTGHASHPVGLRLPPALVYTPSAGDASSATVIQQQQSEDVLMKALSGSVDQQQSADARDAVEGLQALAEQAGLVGGVVEEVSSHVQPQTDMVTTVTTGPDGSVVIPEGEPGTSQTVTITEGSSSSVVEGDAQEEVVQETSSVELTEDQLSSLSSGDMVEMDGELYLVHLAPEPSGGGKQLLTFLPINSQENT